MNDPLIIRDLLVERLRKRNAEVAPFWDFYMNLQAPPSVRSRYSKAYELLLQMSPNPLGKLVVDAISERLSVMGVRLNDPIHDESAWQVWQDNRLDDRQMIVYRDALVSGTSYVSVWPTPDGVHILPEEAATTIVDYEPGSYFVVRSALKMWVDKTAGKSYATLYTPTAIYKWESSLTQRGQLLSDRYLKGEQGWTERKVAGESWPAVNPLGRVPIVPFENRTMMSVGGRSELAELTGIIQRVDKLTLDMLLAAETSAFAQRYIIGAEIPRDEEGNPLPMSWATDKVVAIEDSDAKVGQLLPAPLDGYLKAIDAEVAMLAAVSRVPAHYLYTSSLANPPSAESQRASESGLIYKVEDRQRSFGESWEEVMRLALPLTDSEGYDPQSLRRMEMIWKSADNPTPGALADFALKAQSIGVPKEGVWELMGATPEQIRRWREQGLAQALETLITQPVGRIDAGATDEGTDAE